MPHLTEELWSLMGFASGEKEFLDFAPLPEIRRFELRRRCKRANKCCRDLRNDRSGAKSQR